MKKASYLYILSTRCLFLVSFLGTLFIYSGLIDKHFKEKFTEAATRRVLSKKVFLKISQNSQENTCARVGTLS